MSTDAALLTTGDGSHSLVSLPFGVPYHSYYGAIQESRHVFIDAGLWDRLGEGPKQLRILEMGFGTGLNALLTRQVATHVPCTAIHYFACERFPLPNATAASLNYPQLLDVPPADFLTLHHAPWEQPVALDPNFRLWKWEGDFLAGLPTAWPLGRMDLIYYDAFAPASQPELWTPEALAHCFAALAPGGILVTYCAQGVFKRDLKSVGFTVEGLPGPPGKREMVRAQRPFPPATPTP